MIQYVHIVGIHELSSNPTNTVKTLKKLTDWVKVLRHTWHKIGHFGGGISTR